MFALFLLIASSYVLSVHTSNAGIQKTFYEGNMECSHEGLPEYWLTIPEAVDSDTAMCEFAARMQRYSVYYNYTVRHDDSENKWTHYPVVIEFNDTITRNSSNDPLKYVVEGDGIVRSQLFNGYHAKQWIKNLYDYVPDDREVFYGYDTYPGPTICDENGGYTQRTQATMLLVVYPSSLSKHKINEIHTKTPFDNSYSTFVTLKNGLKTTFETTLNSSGMICYNYYIVTHFATSKSD